MLRITKDDVRGAWKYYGLFYTRPDMVISKEFILKTDRPDEDVLCYDFAEKEWHELDRESFRGLLTREELREHLTEEQELHALWYLEFHQAFNGGGDDAAVAALLRKWTEKKEEFRDEFEPGWPAKYVETTFYLKGKPYSITPASIGLSETSWDEGFLEFLQKEIGRDLKALGATEIRHVGFPD